MNDEPIEDEEFPFKLTLAEPAPRKPKMVDYHSFVSTHVINDKLKSVLENFNLKGVQFIPAEIEGKKGEIFDEYYVIHVYKRIKCTNRNESKFKAFDSGEISLLHKLVLDNKVLEKTPLEERLVFALEELCFNSVFHISVVEKLLEAEPEGMTVYRLSKWDSSEPFKEETSRFFLG